MPSKNAIKTYIENGYYHIYNRGVDKKEIFIDLQDYQVFFYYLRTYLIPKEDSVNYIKQNSNLTVEEKDNRISKLLVLKNYFNRIDLNCFTLMPNHFHFEIRQKDKNSMEYFMRSLLTKYSKYFNKKYKRSGHLFEDRYKAIIVDNVDYFLHLSRYIHLNPRDILLRNKELVSYLWSSYSYYVNNIDVKWLKKGVILSHFYQNYKQKFRHN